jgi:uncharacterized membrane protein
MADNTGGEAKIIYILYLAGIIVGITPLIGIVMAYMNRGDGPDWVQSHYQWQIRTFWIGFLYGVVGLVTTFILIGFLLLLLASVWWIVRCIKGMKALANEQPMENVETWVW